MKIFKEFKEFATRGNVVDLAVGFIVGGAFQKIVTSLVGDVLTPLLSLFTSGINFANSNWTIRAATGSAAAVTINYGDLLQSLIDFIIVAFIVFLMVKGINTLRREPPKPAEVPPAPTAEEKLLTEIRDLLKTGRTS